jgi:predicted outer membrane repeat protein
MTFSSNTALKGSGGGMYFENSSATFAMNMEMLFKYNVANSSGGAMYFKNVKSAYFSQTKALELSSNTAQN